MLGFQLSIMWRQIIQPNNNRVLACTVPMSRIFCRFASTGPKEKVANYERMVAGDTKPSYKDFTNLFRQIIYDRELDPNLFERSVKMFKGCGFCFGYECELFICVLQALRSSDKLSHCFELCQIMRRYNCACVYDRWLFHLGLTGGQVDKSLQLIHEMGPRSDSLYSGKSAWWEVIRGQCEAEEVNFEDVISTFKLCIDKFGAEDANNALYFMFAACSKEVLAESSTYTFVDGTIRISSYTLGKLISLLRQQFQSYDPISNVHLLSLILHHRHRFVDFLYEYFSEHGSQYVALEYVKLLTEGSPRPIYGPCDRMTKALVSLGKHTEAEKFLQKSQTFIDHYRACLQMQ